MKILMPILLVSCFMMLSCSQDGLISNSQEEVHQEYFEIESMHQNLSMRSQNSTESFKVFRTPSSIAIDGSEKDWKRAPKHKMRVEIDLGFELDDHYDLSSYFKMLWDDENLYVFARILDEEINTAAGPLFERDGFEVYIDGNNSKTAADYDNPTFPPAAYGDNTDFFRFIPGEAQALGAWGIIDPSTFETAITLTEDGYNVETRIPFSSFPDFTAEGGHEFGVEFQTNDNDNDQRQQLIKWRSDSDFSFLDPSLFGTAVLFASASE